ALLASNQIIERGGAVRIQCGHAHGFASCGEIGDIAYERTSQLWSAIQRDDFCEGEIKSANSNMNLTRFLAGRGYTTGIFDQIFRAEINHVPIMRALATHVKRRNQPLFSRLRFTSTKQP